MENSRSIQFISAHTTESESESYITTDGQLASLSWNKAPIWGLRPDLYYLFDSYGLILGGALSDERSGLSFVCAAGPCQRNLSRVRVPWDLRPCFTVSHLRLPFSSPPSTRRVTVEDTTARTLGTDLTENIASNSFCIVAFVCAAGVTCFGCRGNVPTEPLPSNGCLFWFHSYAFEPSCHNMILT
jgi:hypothetical protein